MYVEFEDFRVFGLGLDLINISIKSGGLWSKACKSNKG